MVLAHSFTGLGCFGSMDERVGGVRTTGLLPESLDLPFFVAIDGIKLKCNKSAVTAYMHNRI